MSKGTDKTLETIGAVTVVAGVVAACIAVAVGFWFALYNWIIVPTFGFPPASLVQVAVGVLVLAIVVKIIKQK